MVKIIISAIDLCVLLYLIYLRSEDSNLCCVHLYMTNIFNL